MNILVTLDGSPEAESILPKVTTLAGDLQAAITLLNVAEPPDESVREGVEMLENITGATSQIGGVATTRTPMEPGPGSHELRGQTLARIRDEAEGYLAKTAESLRAAGLRVTTEVLIEDDPAEAIVGFVSHNDIDIVAMATHGRSGLNGLIHGSVTGAVIRSGVVPVLTFRPS